MPEPRAYPDSNLGGLLSVQVQVSRLSGGRTAVLEAVLEDSRRSAPVRGGADCIVLARVLWTRRGPCTRM